MQKFCKNRNVYRGKQYCIRKTEKKRFFVGQPKTKNRQIKLDFKLIPFLKEKFQFVFAFEEINKKSVSKTKIYFDNV